VADNDLNPSSASTSRRAVLKGAVGAGVGLAAWSAPKIGTIPAYALTNSSGIYDGVCYYVSFFDEAGELFDAWSGVGTNADSFVGVPTAFNRTYQWTGILPGGANLVVNCAGDPNVAPATISLVGAPSGCVFELASGTAHADDTYDPNLPDGPCIPSGAVRPGTSVTLSAGQILFSGVSDATGQNYVFFNVVCS